MKCDEHGAEGCADCKPAMRAAWTAGQLRAALAHLPDETLLVVNAVDTRDADFVYEQVIVGAGFGIVDWGDGYGPEPSTLLSLNCEIPEGLLGVRPERPVRKAGTR